MSKVLYFEASVKLFHRGGKEKLKGKFIGVGKSYISVKNYISVQLYKLYPEYKQDIKLLPMKTIDGMFIEKLPPNEVEDVEKQASEDEQKSEE